jgi:hypothetical protein
MWTSQQMRPIQSMETSRSQESVQNRGTVNTTTGMATRSAHFLARILSPTYHRYQAILDPKSSKRVFELARDQQDELDHPDPDEDVIEDTFTRPRGHNLEEADEDDDEEEYQGFSGDEERELVNPTFYGLPPEPHLRPGNRRGRYPSARCAPFFQRG